METSFPHIVNLCSNDEAEEVDNEKVTPYLTTNSIRGIPGLINSSCQPEFECHVRRQSFEEYESPYGYPKGYVSADMGVLYDSQFRSTSASPASAPICKQFWKAGDYDAVLPVGPVSQNGQNRLRVHPKFLHSNATSHKWAFGALAELLDNAVDEVKNGASFVVVDKIKNAKDGNPALLIQDDGGGMDPESLRHCMSFGFSNKQSDSSIGQYGNGFKTSTMRLGADVIVFSRCMDKRNVTQSIGLLSFTFLRQTNRDDIVVPMVDYEIDPLTGACIQLIRHGKKQFYSNLSTLLRWSPFASEAELLNQFNDIGHHGTKVVVFNLWFNDDGDMELDFDGNTEDIMISGAPEMAKTKSIGKILDQNHIATRFRYSLRVYSSILYLHLPVNFRIILRGKVVEPHHIVKDLKYCECIKYKPQVGGNIEHSVITTIGFLEGAPYVSIHGFSVYHKNRLILPFWPVLIKGNGNCRGVAGVLEVNFMKPTHNKQDFERSNLYQKLETRLRDMTMEYWNYHCHLVGYPATKTLVHDQTLVPSHRMPHLGTDCQIRRDTENLSCFTANVSGADSLTRVSHIPTHNGQTCSLPEQLTISTNNSQKELPRKRRDADCLDAKECSKKPAVGLRSNQKNKVGI